MELQSIGLTVPVEEIYDRIALPLKLLALLLCQN